MKNLKYFFCILSFLSFFGCTKEMSTYSFAEIENKSGVNIKLNPYISGIERIDLQYNFEINSIVNFSTNTYMGRGEQIGLGFVNEIISQSDSLKIIFNDSCFVIHYRNRAMPSHPTEKSILPENPRNIMNLENWKWKYDKTSKGIINNYYNFQFTEADYEFAKD